MKIVLEKGQSLFFTSDTHYNHSNICRATTKWTDADSVTRDFKSLDLMNDTIVNNINERVGENDILIHLGDWSFGGFEMIEEFRSRIVCKNIHLILGNHDHHIDRNKNGVQKLFTSVNHYANLDIRYPDKINKGIVHRLNFVAMHYPIASWDGMNDNTIHIHGHVHLPKHLRIAEGKAIDVGMDGNDMYPLGLLETFQLVRHNPIKTLVLPKDHHVKRLA
jgi:calcineurin-like phosphoesterase family protein